MEKMMSYQLLIAVVIGFYFFCLSFYYKKKLKLAKEKQEEKTPVQVILYGTQRSDGMVLIATVYISRRGNLSAPANSGERELKYCSIKYVEEQVFLGAPCWKSVRSNNSFEVVMLGQVFKSYERLLHQAPI